MHDRTTNAQSGRRLHAVNYRATTAQFAVYQFLFDFIYISFTFTGSHITFYFSEI